VKLDGRVVVITGASTGIGRGIANAFVREGAKAVLAARNEQRLKIVANELQSQGARVLAVPTDVSRESDVIVLFEKSKSEFGRVDILINNAGIFRSARLMRHLLRFGREQ